MEKITLHVSGMACGGCASAIAQALLAQPGVVEAEVSHIEATAVIAYDPARVQPEQLKMTVEQAGYKVVD
ncbi:MAG TPA: heavy-metal-associated domain-containing protein [Methylophilaceae bacterium]|nr:heavy-metal-associated domain-containing protein [Methylophilaceae bacterium]